jgi:hypothetical protein
MHRIEIGGTPCDENCVATGKTLDFEALNRLECDAYTLALRRFYGEPPEGSWFRNKANSHDFGTYFEVVYVYDPAIDAHLAYASRVEQGLKTWSQAGMGAPVLYDEHSQVVLKRTVEESILEKDWVESMLAYHALVARNA